MIRYLTVLSIALSITTVVGCEKSKLQEEVMGDSTWENETGNEDTWGGEGRPAKRDQEREQDRIPVKEAPPAKEQKPESSFDQVSPRVFSGIILRDELLPVLDEGLGRFLQNVDTEPDFHQGAFVGFRIVSLFPGEPAFASLDLRVGDTVTRINGKPIERPEQAAAVWEDLRTASDLVVDYQRNGEKHALHFTIADET